MPVIQTGKLPFCSNSPIVCNNYRLKKSDNLFTPSPCRASLSACLCPWTSACLRSSSRSCSWRVRTHRSANPSAACLGVLPWYVLYITTYLYTHHVQITLCLCLVFVFHVIFNPVVCLSNLTEHEYCFSNHVGLLFVLQSIS